jgi:hypothetical protein
MKDVVRRCIATKLYETHPAHYLQMSKVSVIIFKLLDLLNLTLNCFVDFFSLIDVHFAIGLLLKTT